MNKQLIISALQSTGFLVVNRVLITELGLLEAVCLCNYVDKYRYFLDQEKLMGDSFYFPHKRQAMELSLKPITVQRIKQSLIQSGIISVKKQGMPAKEWITIEWESLEKLLFPDPRKSRGQDPRKSRGQDPRKSRGQDPRKSRGHILIRTDKIKTENKKDIFSPEILNVFELNSRMKKIIEIWLQYKKERGQSYKPTGLKSFIAQLVKLSDNDHIKAKKIINQSMANNWAGIFPLKETQQTPPPGSNRTGAKSVQDYTFREYDEII